MEGLEGSLLAQELDLINVLVSAIIPSAGVAFRILVGHGRAKGIEYSTGCDILGGDEDDRLALALNFFFL
jgi:hypothetical protein